MKTFILKISSPEGDIFCGEVTKLSLRVSGGDIAILAGHIPFISAITPGECKIEFDDESKKFALTDGGILNVTTDKVMLLSGSFRWK